MKDVNFESLRDINENLLKLTVESENIDSIAEKVALNDCPDFIIPFVRSEINGNIVYKYKVGNLLAVKYLEKEVNKVNFIKLIKNVLEPFMTCEEWFMDYRRFYLNMENIYIKKEDYTIKYIYIFSDDYCSTDEDVKTFITELIKKIRISDDSELKLELVELLLTNEYTISDILAIISKYEKKFMQNGNQSAVRSAPRPQPVVQQPVPKPQPAPQPAPKPQIFQQPAPAPKPAPAPQPVVQQPAPKPASSGGDDFDIDDLFNDGPSNKKSKAAKPAKEKSGRFSLFGKKEKPAAAQFTNTAPAPAPAVIPQPINPQPIINTADDDDSTQFIIPGNEPTQAAPKEKKVTLQLCKTQFNTVPEIITLSFKEKTELTIGREGNSPSHKSDYILPGVSKEIGRKHIQIEQHGDKYYIIDLASRNGTYLNGQMIFPNQLVELESEALITFGNDIVTYKFIIS
ncbi:MAG: FHA domain-containing protein [Oscillospiraceae bacterium]|nr:FHA domain-containing protein [Oscillospiraceae bacterium]